jgi:hypothetical protein
MPFNSASFVASIFAKGASAALLKNRTQQSAAKMQRFNTRNRWRTTSI